MAPRPANLGASPIRPNRDHCSLLSSRPIASYARSAAFPRSQRHISCPSHRPKAVPSPSPFLSASACRLFPPRLPLSGTYSRPAGAHSIRRLVTSASAAAAASPWPAGDGRRENSGANSDAAAAAAAPGGQAEAQAGASGARSAAGRRKVFAWEADAGADAPPRLHSSWATAPAPLPPSPKDSSILGEYLQCLYSPHSRSLSLGLPAPSLPHHFLQSIPQVNRLDGLATGKVVDVLLNHETVVQFNNQRLDLMHYDSLLRDYQRESVNLEKVSAALNGGQTTIISIGLAAVMAMAGLRVAVGRMTVGDLVLVNGLILQLSLPLQFLGFLYRDLRQSLVDMEAMFHMLSLESDLKDGDLELAARAEGVAVDVRDISFSYMNGRQVLKGVSFSIAPGESVAIVGPSGSGKSTIVKLLLRLYDPSEGSISFDGTDARELKQESLRQAVAVVPQDTVLFNDSIRYNIAYGRPSASVAEVDRAAGQAKLLDAIRRMPDGFDTVVGERGLKLSGGEKQRVAIARAFLKNPRLLVCDEATSALDSATEANILRSLQQLAAGRSCLFVAHRLSTIKHCDKILVMETGRVVEQGTHEQLLAAGGKYAAMWMLQDSERPALAPIPRPTAHATHTPAPAASVNGDETEASLAGAVAAATAATAAAAAASEHQGNLNGTANFVHPHGSNGAVTSMGSGSGGGGMEGRKSGGDAELKEQLRAVAVSELEWRTDGRAPVGLEEVGRRRDGEELITDEGGHVWNAHEGHGGAEGESGATSGSADGGVGVGAEGMHQDGEHVDGEGAAGGRSGGRVRGLRQTSMFLSEFARAGEYTGSEERVEDMVIAEDEIEREESEGESDGEMGSMGDMISGPSGAKHEHSHGSS
ncbi:unnamed protein product [Closterium sp. NIES-54]